MNYQSYVMVLERYRLAIRLAMLMFALVVSSLFATSRAEAACTLPNQITNGQPADATAVMANLNAVKDCADAAAVPSGAPAAGNLAVFAGPKSVTGGDLSGDCTTSGTLSIICTKANGTALGYFSTGADAAQLTGTVSVNRFNGGVNADVSHFLRGDGVWATPPGGGGGGTGQPWYLAYKPLIADFTVVSGDASNPTLADDPDEGLIFNLGPTPTATSNILIMPTPAFSHTEYATALAARCSSAGSIRQRMPIIPRELIP